MAHTTIGIALERALNQTRLNESDEVKTAPLNALNKGI